jgi:hypothetical protein
LEGQGTTGNGGLLRVLIMDGGLLAGAELNGINVHAQACRFHGAAGMTKRYCPDESAQVTLRMLRRTFALAGQFSMNLLRGTSCSSMDTMFNLQQQQQQRRRHPS